MFADPHHSSVVVYNGQMVPLHLSYSTLTTWERCKKSYQLGKIVEAPAKPAVYFAGGTAVHKLTEEIDTTPDWSEDLDSAWRRHYYPVVAQDMEASSGLYWDTKYWLSGADTPEDWDTIGPQCVSNWQKFVKEEVASLDSVELDVTTSLPGCPVPIKGFIDRVVVHKTHGPMIIDIKTGKSKPKDTFQLATYAAMIGVKMQMAPIKGAYFMAREGKLAKVHTFDDLFHDAVTIGERYYAAYQEMVEAERTGMYPAKREFTCQWCTQQDNCLTYSGSTKQALKFDADIREGKAPF
jgi:hypothetical protein